MAQPPGENPALGPEAEAAAAAVQLVPAAHPAIAGPVVVAVMDGVGLGRRDDGDAVHLAHTPCLDAVLAKNPWRPLAAHGPAVGLASAQDMGNSEVGHNALGAGQIYDQGAKRVAQSVQDGSLFHGANWAALVAHVTRPGAPAGAALHLLGLLSDGNVHSHIDHALAVVRRAHHDGVGRLFVHVLLDGRDVARTSALKYAAQLEAVLAEINALPNRCYRVASGGGRMQITMDRYQADWPMVERGWRCHVRAQGEAFACLTQAIETLRARHPGIADQDLPAFVIAAPSADAATDSLPSRPGPQSSPAPDAPGPGLGPLRDGDAVLLFNFRGDRMLQLVDALEAPHFTAFARGPRPNVLLVGMTLYDGDTHRPRHFLLPPPTIRNTLSELLANAGINQLACSETQKFGHVTYFWNGNRTQPFAHESSIEVQSAPGPFDRDPCMRAEAVAQAVLARLQTSPTRFVRLNLANGDMVGHTGDLVATVRAMEAVDAALARLVEGVVQRLGGALIITADHGNAEDMVERHAQTGAPLRDAQGALIGKTSHSLNPVPCAFVLPEAARGRFALTDVACPGLANVAASCAVLLGYEPPALWQPSLLRPCP